MSNSTKEPIPANAPASHIKSANTDILCRSRSSPGLGVGATRNPSTLRCNPPRPAVPFRAMHMHSHVYASCRTAVLDNDAQRVGDRVTSGAVVGARVGQVR